jgi:hypothetical protein
MEPARPSVAVSGVRVKRQQGIGGMVNVAVGLSPFIVTISLSFFFSVIALQGLSLILEGSVHRKLPSFLSLSPISQNLGITCALIGLTFRDLNMAVLGLLFIAFGMVASRGRFYALHPYIELPLLISGLLSTIVLMALHLHI